jgi:hypothetical protein
MVNCTGIKNRLAKYEVGINYKVRLTQRLTLQKGWNQMHSTVEQGKKETVFQTSNYPFHHVLALKRAVFMLAA